MGFIYECIPKIDFTILNVCVLSLILEMSFIQRGGEGLDMLERIEDLNRKISTLDFRQDFERFYRLPLTPIKTDCNLRCEHENETLCDIYLV